MKMIFFQSLYFVKLSLHALQIRLKQVSISFNIPFALAVVVRFS